MLSSDKHPATDEPTKTRIATLRTRWEQIVTCYKVKVRGADRGIRMSLPSTTTVDEILGYTVP